MATLQQIREQVILDFGLQGDSQFPSTRLNYLINQAQRFVQVQLNGLGLKKWEKAITLNSTAHQLTANPLVIGRTYTISANPSGASFTDVGSPDNNVGTMFIATGTTTSDSWDGAVLTWYSASSDLASDQFVGSQVLSFLIAKLTGLAESPHSIRFIDLHDGSSNYGLAREVNEDYALEHLQNSLLAPTVKEPFFWRMSGKVFIAPNTIVGGNVHYYGVVTDLVNDSDVSEIPPEYIAFVVNTVGVNVDEIRGKIKDPEAARSEVANSISQAWTKVMGSAELKKADDKQSLQ